MSESSLDLQPSIQTLLHHQYVQLLDLGEERILVAYDYRSSEPATVNCFDDGEESLARKLSLCSRFFLGNDPIGGGDRDKAADRDNSLERGVD